ncbi:fimbrial-like adhesin protein [Escherichia coli]|nr:fimbrial-like adhesin protein [Escherichia coli]
MKRSIIAAAVFSSFFMSAGVFAADVDTGTLTIKGNIAESPCKFEAGGDSVSINMPTVPTTVFEGKAKYSTYDDAVGVTSSMLKISCPKEVAGVKLSLITNDKITGNDKAIASSNDTVGYYLYLGDKEGANKRGNTSRLTQSFHFFMFEPIFSPVNALNQPI